MSVQLGTSRISAPASTIARPISGKVTSSQISTPIRPTAVSNTRAGPPGAMPHSPVS